MEPTIEVGAELTVCLQRSTPIQAGEIVYVQLPEMHGGAELGQSIFRAVATGASSVVITDDGLLVDGELVQGTAGIKAPESGPGSCVLEPNGCDVPVDHLFVLGDFHPGSRDSRVFGPLPTADVLGVVLLG